MTSAKRCVFSSKLYDHFLLIYQLYTHTVPVVSDLLYICVFGIAVTKRIIS